MLSLLLAMTIGGAAPQGDTVLSASDEAEAVALLREYLRLDTTNPPGNEIIAARYFADHLAKLGIPAQVIEIAPKRANVYARIKGDGSKRPLILTHHLDVVEADPSTWRHPPFSGALAEGAIWGRGALDMKGTAIAQLMVMKLLHARRVPLARDVIFLGLADEEDASQGAQWIFDHGQHLVAGAELALNEGATIAVENGKVSHYGVSTMEKQVLWLELAATGADGHGSTPASGSAIAKLTRAVARLQAHSPPVRLTESVAAYFATTADRSRVKAPDKLRRLAQHLNDTALLAQLTADPFYNALLRDTVAVTGLQAGGKVNVIPGKATALLDCRLLPGTQKETMLAWLRRTLDDPSLTLREILYMPTQESPVESELMRAIRKLAARHHPGAPVVPLPLTGTTDSSVLRRLGIVTYGFEPFPITQAEQDTQHGTNERIRVESFTFGVRFMLELVLELGARTP